MVVGTASRLISTAFQTWTFILLFLHDLDKKEGGSSNRMKQSAFTFHTAHRDIHVLVLSF